MSKISKSRFLKLAGLLNKQKVQRLNEIAQPIDDDAKRLLMKYVCWLRMLQLWFHGAHHSVDGTAFSGDHSNLYERIYTEIQDEIDAAFEKAIGITNDEMLACPKCVTSKVSEMLNKYPSPMELDPRELAETGLKIEQDYIDFVERIFRTLEEKGMLSLGLNDQLAASANTHEVYVYLLQQRSRVQQSTEHKSYM